jgi:4-hydroxyphenylpyruvate dioxygenase
MQLSQIAITSVSTQQKNVVEALDAYTQAGFRNVELVLPLLKSWLAEGHTVDDAKHLLATHNLRCIGGFENIINCFGTSEAMQQNHEMHVDNGRLLHQLGGGTMVVGTDGPSTPSFEAIEAISTTLHGLARQLEGLDVSLALEFNWSPCIKSLKSAALVCEQANHPQLGILFDPAHYYTTTTKFEHLTRETVRWIKHVHINDMRDKPGEISNCNDDRVLPGKGIVGLPALIARLEEYGYTGYFSIEMFSEELWRLPAVEAARLCYNSMVPLCT